MAIERPTSFHLMLSDDEHALLRLLAEREGLNASDYLRLLLRRAAGGDGGAQLSRIRQVIDLLGPELNLENVWAGQQNARKAVAARVKKKKGAAPTKRK